MYAIHDVNWRECPTPKIDRSNHPDNVFWVSETDETQGWLEAIEIIRSRQNAVAIWDTLPNLDHISDEIVPLLDRFNFRAAVENDKFLLGDKKPKRFVSNLSRVFSKNLPDWRKDAMLRDWFDATKAITLGLSKLQPTKFRSIFLEVGKGLSGNTRSFYDTEENPYGIHVDGGALRELNVAWPQFGATTVFLAENDIHRTDNGFFLKTETPALWSMPNALAVFACGGVVHGSPISDINNGSVTEKRAFYRQRFIPEYNV